MEDPFERALELVDAAHAEDPTKIFVNGQEIAYELHYSNKMSQYLEKREPSASPALRLAVRAQHLRRWEVPRNSYPMTKIGYHAWRTYLKKRQAEIASQISSSSGLSSAEIDKIARLIRKEDLKRDAETQVLEDVACLVFLEDQFSDFEKQHDEGKIISILQKTWGKMSDQGHDLALHISMTPRCKDLVSRALETS